MRYMTVIFFIASCLYYIQPEGVNDITVCIFGNDVPIWKFEFFFLFDFTLSFAFFELRRLSVVKIDKKIYLYAGLFTGFLTLFQVFTFFQSGLWAYYNACNSWIWGAIAAILIVLILIALLHDRSKQI